MSKKLLLLVLCVTFAVPSALVAQNKSSGSRKHSTSSETTGKTVHVRSYKKKNGTVVKSYNRRPPNSKGAKTEAAPKDEAPHN
jgi:hypothetical protein